MDPSTVSSATTALTTLGRGGHVQRITATGTYVAESLELNRSVGRHGKVKKRIGYLEVEDDTGSAIEITSTPLIESPESSGSHHRHASLTGAMKASTFSCPSTVKNTATTSATTPTDGADPFRFLKPNRRAEGQGHNSTAPLRNYLHAPSPAAAPDLDPPILASPSLSLASSTFGHLRNDNGNRANNNPNARSDRTTLLLPSLLFLVVGVLPYALYKYLYTYFPPHILPCAAGAVSACPVAAIFLVMMKERGMIMDGRHLLIVRIMRVLPITMLLTAPTRLILEDSHHHHHHNYNNKKKTDMSANPANSQRSL